MNRDEKSMDTLLKRALGSSERPDPELIRRVKLEAIKEDSRMNKTTVKRSFGAAAAAIACVLISATAFAAWYFLTPSQVADEFEYPALAEAFESDDALIINEMQSDGGYDVSLLGIVSGKGLDGFAEELDISKTYAVMAIAKQDGAMPDTRDDDYDSTPFFVSPLIHGQIPWQFNMASMGGGHATFVRDGVMYRLVECDSIEMFADRGLTLIVSSTVFYDINAYNYDESTGLVAPNPDFDGVNLMFDLPLDTSKADYEKAQEYLDNLWGDNTGRAEQSAVPEENADINLNITDKGSVVEEVMTYETMTAWIQKRLAETQAKVDSGEYSESSMALDRADYEGYLKYIEDGRVVTVYTYEDGSYAVSAAEPSDDFSLDTDATQDSLEIKIGDRK